MSAPTPATIRSWQLDADADITVNVRIPDECFDSADNVITISDEQGGTVYIYRSAVNEFIDAVRAAADEADAADSA